MKTRHALALIAATAIVASVTSVSAVSLITGDDIANGTITGADIRDASIKRRDLGFESVRPTRIHSNHAPLADVTTEAEGDYGRIPLDGTFGVMESLTNVPAGSYLVEATFGLYYNMQGAFRATCGFQTSTGSTSVQGSQDAIVEQVANKTNQYQIFSMAPMVLLTLPAPGQIDLVCKATYTNNGLPRPENIYMYAQPVADIRVSQ